MFTAPERIKPITTTAFVFSEAEEGILYFNYHDKIVIELKDVKKAFELYENHSKNYTMKVLIEFGAYSSITTEARAYIENKQMPTPAQAVIIHNLAQRILARFYKFFRKDTHPLRFFKQKDEAIEWLKAI